MNETKFTTQMGHVDAYVESCASDLMLRAGREIDAGPRRFYRAAANALQRVRRAYADEWSPSDARRLGSAIAKEAFDKSLAPGEAEDQGGAQ